MKDVKVYNLGQMKIFKILSIKMTKTITVDILFQKKLLKMNLARNQALKKKRKCFQSAKIHKSFL